MITIAISKVIRSPRSRVWKALVTPEELIRWDTRRLSLRAPAPEHPAPGHAIQWRCEMGSVSVEQSEEPLEVVPDKRLRSAVRLGSFEFEETYTLSDEEPEATRVSLRLAAKNSLPLLGGELDRFDVRRLCAERVDDTLEMLARHCEAASGR